MLWALSFFRPISRHGFRLDNGSKILKRFHCTRHINKTEVELRQCKSVGKSVSLVVKLRTHCITSLTLVTGSALLKSVTSQRVECKAEVRPSTEQAVFDWIKFLRLISLDIWSIIGSVVAALVTALLNIQLPRRLGDVVNVMAQFMNHERGPDFMEAVQGPALILIAIYMAQSVATYCYIQLLSDVGERFATRLKSQLFASILRQDMEFFDRKRTGELVDCIMSDVQELKSSFKQVISQGLRSVTQIVGCVASMYMMSPALTMGMLVIVTTAIMGGTMLGTLLRSTSMEAQKQSALVTTTCEETISNLRTVRAFANEQLENERFESEVEKAQALQQKLGRGIAAFQAASNLFLNGITLGTLYVGGYLMVRQEMNAGNLMSFLVFTQTIQRSLAQLSLVFGNYIKGIQAGSRVFEFINSEEKMHLTHGKQIPYHSLVADVEFDNVTFAYPTRPEQVILKNFNLKLPAGKTVAIVGTSGNGKSTIAALLERFYDVNDGSIRLAGVDLRELNPSWLRGQVIGLINQEPVLFATTIKENIRYGRPDASDEQVYEAAKLANADQFIQQFPIGYETVLGERGVTISGGQKQRIAIARALIKNPAVLILDEATSALDTESEKVVQEALEVVSKHRTTLVIAHRLSTIQHADVIVVLDKGKIVEMGNHTTLMKEKGYYWNLMNQQSANQRAQA